jgi:DNA polymerase-3 subunit epsilon
MATVRLFKLLLSKDLEKEILISSIKADIKKGLSPKLLDIVEIYLHELGFTISIMTKVI